MPKRKVVVNVALKTAIFKSGRSQKTISVLARLGETRLSHMVRGRTIGTDKERARLSRVLNVPVTELFPDAALPLVAEPVVPRETVA
jgi:hypothetical protein